MKMYFYGHNCRYAVEQAIMTFFPNERPEYSEGVPEGVRCETRVSHGAEFVSCSCVLVTEKGMFHGLARLGIKAMGDNELARISALNGLVKKSIYKAALASGIPAPSWGSLTGVRPAKLLSRLLRAGLKAEAAKNRFIKKYAVSEERAELCLSAAAYSEKIKKELHERDICLYVGIPFCPTRCNYCSFVSQSVERSMHLIEPFLTALFKEIVATAKAVRLAGLRPVSMYMGGGTPTTLSAEQLDRLCSCLSSEFDLSALREYTVEAGRPDTITYEKLLVLASHGVGRISVNPQTMRDSVLNAIGRKHSARDILDAIATVRKFPNFSVNMDLIAGLYNDDYEGFRDSLIKILELSPENITVHTLSRKRGAALVSEGLLLPDAAEVGKMLDFANRSLNEAGYSPYYLYRQKFMSGNFENIGWTSSGFHNLYNICIMEELCSIISLGAGASTKLVSGNGRMERFINAKYPTEYIGGVDKICSEKERIISHYGV